MLHFRSVFSFLILGCLCFAAPVQKSEPKVVLLSIDGAADWILDDLLARGVLKENGAFGQMRAKGAYAEAMKPVNITGTAVSHTSLFTGVTPGQTGVPANNFVDEAAAVRKRTSGFVAPVEAETLWRIAMRQGLSVTCATAVGADGRSDARSCTKTLGYGQRRFMPAVTKLSATDAEAWQKGGFEAENLLPLGRREDSPHPLSWRRRRGSSKVIFAVAVDRTFDAKVNYDGLILDDDRNLDNGYLAYLKPEQWTDVLFRGGGQELGARCYLGSMSDLQNLELYLGQASFSPGGPDAFHTSLKTNVGIWPGDPDHRNFIEGRLPQARFDEQVEALHAYLEGVVSHEIVKDDWRLLMTYLPTVDTMLHYYLVTDPRQADYDLEEGARRQRFASYVAQAFQRVDQTLSQWMALAGDDVNFVVVSDHGIAPTHSVVQINGLLARAGIQVSGKGGTDAWAVTTGPTAQIYVNHVGRQGGTVSMEERDTVVSAILKACKAFKDPKTGEAVFELVKRGQATKDLGLFSEKLSGDVFVAAKPGYSVSSRMDLSLPMVLPVSYREDALKAKGLDHASTVFARGGGLNEVGVAVHGHLGHHRKLESIFYGVGPDIKKGQLGTVSALDVLPTIGGLLGIEVPASIKGQAIFSQ